MIHDFIRQFSDMKITAVKIGNEYYHCPEPVAKLKNSIKVRPYSAGIFLGIRTKGGKIEFKPSVALLDILSKNSDKKIFVDKKGEWLFLCGRDLFGKSIKKANFNEEDELVLVQNENDENLGYGLIVTDVKHSRNKDKVVVENLLDRGSFLRREKNQT